MNARAIAAATNGRMLRTFTYQLGGMKEVVYPGTGSGMYAYATKAFGLGVSLRRMNESSSAWNTPNIFREPKVARSGVLYGFSLG